MKSITEILGGCQMVFGISFDIQEVFEGYDLSPLSRQLV